MSTPWELSDTGSTLHPSGRRWKKPLVITAAAVVATAVLVFAYLLFLPQASVAGPHTVKVAQGDSSWSPPQATATTPLPFAPANGTEVEAQGTVDVSTVGTYSLVYQASRLPFSRTVEVTVDVVDRTAPVLEILGTNPVPGCPGHPGAGYEDEGATASDNNDGDLTGSIQVDTRDDAIVYTVRDAAGNEATATRELTQDDSTPPLVELAGDVETRIYQGSSFTEPGHSATDNCAGDLTGSVAVSGSVDRSRVGVYTLTYSVTDETGNTGTATRTVQVVQPPSDGKTRVYLTFDDGPLAGSTDQFLDVLQKENVKATFFVTLGHTGAAADKLLQREVNEGHQIALHTASHVYSDLYSSEDAYFADLVKVHDHVLEVTGVDARVVRFPGGSSNTISANYSQGIMTRLAAALPERGYRYIDWNVDSGDGAGLTDHDALLENLKSETKAGRANVVLMHDTHPTSAAVLKKYIEWCRSQGYSFGVVDMAGPDVHHTISN